jgi:aminopeptidase
MIKTNMPSYQPSQKILQKYANVLVNFALNSGKGVRVGEIVRITASESAKPLFIELRKTVLKAGAHPLTRYLPDNDQRFSPSRDFYQIANESQLKFFPKKYAKGLVDQIDHEISVVSTRDKQVLKGIDPQKIMTGSKSQKPLRDWFVKKENQGKFTWTIALYGTSAMAKEARLSKKEYWQQIIKGCFLDQDDPVAKWKQVSKKNEIIRQKLNSLPIDKLHIKGLGANLWIKMGDKRLWKGGNGRNIPSFEIFTSPDWRGTEGTIKFNQPLYVFGNLIKNVELEFRQGQLVKAHASYNKKVLQEMIKTKNADKVGEFSLTDGRFSKITKFMAETLFDENVGGKQGNTHIALGMSYQDCYDGNPEKLSKKQWKDLGFNDSAVHTDIVSTSKRTVTAYLKNGKKKVIYSEGRFTI